MRIARCSHVFCDANLFKDVLLPLLPFLKMKIKSKLNPPIFLSITDCCHKWLLARSIVWTFQHHVESGRLSWKSWPAQAKIRWIRAYYQNQKPKSWWQKFKSKLFVHESFYLNLTSSLLSSSYWMCNIWFFQMFWKVTIALWELS